MSIFDNLLVEKYRPNSLSELVLSEENRAAFKHLIATQEIPQLMFYGAPGGGKSSLAKILVKELDAQYRYINASDERGIDAIRDAIIPFAQTKSLDGRLKIIILDEADNITGDAQRALRNTMEEYSDNLRFILTANYRNKIIEPLRSRTIQYEIVPPLRGILERLCGILTNEGIELPPDQIPLLKGLINKCYPDIRTAINLIQKYSKDKVLNITAEFDACVFAKKVLEKLNAIKNLSEIREFVIQNELEFNNDYQALLKGLFEEVYVSVIDDAKRAQALCLIGDALYKHQSVMDPEINAFCCLIQLKAAI